MSPRALSPTYSRTSRASVGHADATPLARASLARDLEEDPDFDSRRQHNVFSDNESDAGAPEHEFSMVDSYRRPSFIVNGTRSCVVMSGTSLPADHGYLSKWEQEAATREERSLLRDNNLIPPKHPRRASEDNFGSRIGRKLSLHRFPSFRTSSRSRARDEEDTIGSQRDASERTALLGDHVSEEELPYGGEDLPETIHRKWSEAVAGGQVHTTWQRETKVLSKYSRSLILSFLLQYSLNVASVFTIGHIGKIELGAVSLASSMSSFVSSAHTRVTICSLAES